MVLNSSIAVMILAGGKATRLGAICEKIPKSMLPVRDAPFLSYLVTYYYRVGLAPIIILVAHLSQSIVNFFSGPCWRNVPVYVLVTKMNGTGGDLVEAARLLAFEHLLVLNGDTVVEYPVWEVVAQHTRSEAVGTIVLSRLKNVPNAGAFFVGERNNVLYSLEADLRTGTLPDDRLVRWRGSSTGVLLFRRKPLLDLAEGINIHGHFSLERELLPHLILQNQLMAFDNGERFFLDFGTKERLAYMQDHTAEILKIYGSPITC